MKKRMIIPLICSLVLTGCSQFSDTIGQVVSDSLETAPISEKATEAGYTAEGEEDESKSEDREDIGTRKEDPAKDGDIREESEVETSESEGTATTETITEETQEETAGAVENPENKEALATYLKFLQQHSSERQNTSRLIKSEDAYMFSLLDIDQDGIDELIYERNDMSPEELTVFTFENGQMKEIDTLSSGCADPYYYDADEKRLFAETEHHGNVHVTVYFRDGEDWKWESCTIVQSDWYFLDFDNTVLSYSEFYEAARKANAIEMDAEGREMLFLRNCSLEEGYEEYKTYAEQYKTFTDRYAMLTFSDMLEHDERYLKTYANTAQNRNQFFRSDDIAYQEIMDTSVVEEAKESYAAITEYGEGNYWVERSRGAEATYIDHGDYYEIPNLCIWTRFIVPAEIMQQCRDGYTFTIRPNDEDYTVTVVSSYIATDDDHITSFQLNDDTFIFYNRDENGKPIDGSGCIMAVDEIYTATGLYYGSLCFRKDCKFSFYNSSGTEVEQSSFADYWERKSSWTFFYGKPVFDMETGLITEFQEYWVQ